MDRRGNPTIPQHAIKLDDSTPGYPGRLREKGSAKLFPNLWVIGGASLLDQPLLGLLCSMRCPGRVILRTYDLARELRGAAVSVVVGFHSPMEKECLDLLLRGNQPVVNCPARSLDRMRLPLPWRSRVGARRILVISPFAGRQKRVTAELAQERNGLVGALATKVVVVYANP